MTRQRLKYIFIFQLILILSDASALQLQLNQKIEHHTFAELKPRIGEILQVQGNKYVSEYDNIEYSFEYLGDDKYIVSKTVIGSKGEKIKSSYRVDFSPVFLDTVEGHHIYFSYEINNGIRWEMQYIEDFNDIGDEFDEYVGGNTKFTEDKDYYRFSDISGKYGGSNEFYVMDLKRNDATTNNADRTIKGRELRLIKMVDEMFEMICVISGYSQRVDDNTKILFQINKLFIIPESSKMHIDRHTTSFSNLTKNSTAVIRDVEDVRFYLFTDLNHEAADPSDSTYHYNQVEIWGQAGMTYYAEARGLSEIINYVIPVEEPIFFDDEEISEMRDQSKFLTLLPSAPAKDFPLLQQVYSNLISVLNK